MRADKPLLLKIVVLFLILTNVLMLSLLINLPNGTNYSSATGFYFLDPAIAEMEVNEYNTLKDSYITSYAGLIDDVKKTINMSGGDYSFYFEDLKTGIWLGVNEKVGYEPASLGKIPVLVGMLKKIEDREININDYMTITEGDVDFRYGNSIMREGTNNITVRSLMNYVTKDSDNTANNVLVKNLTNEELYASLSGLGLPIWSVTGPRTFSARQVANSFRSLYISSYLRRSYSRFALALLANDEQPSFIKHGLPEDVRVSHKIGEWINETGGESYLHDCGIIYHPNNSYIICIMSQHKERITDEYSMYVQRVFSAISKKVYDYVSTHGAV